MEQPSFQSRQMNIPGRNAFADGSSTETRSLRGVRRSVDTSGQIASERVRLPSSERSVKSSADQDFDTLSLELDKLDQLSRHEPMRKGVRVQSDRAYPAEGLTGELARRKTVFEQKMAKVADKYAALPDSSLMSNLRGLEELRLRRELARAEAIFGSKAAHQSQQLEAYKVARERASTRDRHPEQKPFDRFNREDGERLRRWDEHLVENVSYDDDLELERLLRARSHQRP